MDMAASSREERRILFHPVVHPVPGGSAPGSSGGAAVGAAGDPSAERGGEVVARHSLSALPDGGVELVRAVGDGGGLVSTLIARAADAGALVEVFADIPLARQLVRGDGGDTALSWTLEPSGLDSDGDGPEPLAEGYRARLQLQHVLAAVGPLCLSIDVSTGAGMPADVLLVTRSDWSDHLRETLASGALAPWRHPVARTLSVAPRRPDPEATTMLAALPDDVLAVLGPQWRPLVWQGARWKGVQRLIGREPGRSARASDFAAAALAHLASVIDASPSRYHERHAAARRRVWLRRLKPAMALLAILAVMPLSWLFVSRGGGEMHPLVLGLSPLMMVGVVLMSTREIPVLEIPPLPRPLAPDRWHVAVGEEGGR